MIGYTFKAYVANGREHFVYGEEQVGKSQLRKKDFPFPESLFAMLYLDIWKLEPLFRDMDRALQNLYQSRDGRYADELRSILNTLAKRHIYFELLRLDWRYRLERAEAQGYEDVLELLPHKTLARIPSEIDTLQKQTLTLLRKALDIDGGKKPVQERMAAYYAAGGGDTLHTFQFASLPVRFEPADRKAFTDVLYPEHIYHLHDFFLRECVKRELKMRVCKNCGRYFTFTKRTTAEYCLRVVDEKGRTCKDVGAAITWTRQSSGNRAFTTYRREYKKRFAWIKAGKILPEELYAWGEKAREKKAECENGTISLEEFEQWLKDS